MRKRLYILIFLFFIGLAPGYSQGLNDAIILDYQTRVKIENRKRIEERTATIQINNKEGDWISDITIPYQHGDKIEIIEAVILNMNNEVQRKVKKKEIISRNDISYGTFYSDRYVKEFKLKWSNYPYRIRYSYRRVSNQYLFIAHWTPLLYLSVPVENASLLIQVPNELDIAINAPDNIIKTLDEADGTRIYKWKSDYSVQIKKEVFGQNLKDRIPSVIVIPKVFDYNTSGSQESWTDFGNWLYQINESLIDLTPEEEIEVKQIVDGITDKRALVNRLYHHLQENIRYINISIDEGGMVPYPASYVCKNKYGDCKALTIYMKALLKYVDIESFYTLVNAGDNSRKINVDFPSQQFNHVILAVVLEQDTIWLENTVNYIPAGYLGTFTQNRYGLFIDEDRSQVVKIPALKTEDCLEKNNYQFSINKSGEGILKLHKEAKGPEFENYTYLSTEFNQKDIDRVMRRREFMKNAESIIVLRRESRINQRFL